MTEHSGVRANTPLHRHSRSGEKPCGKQASSQAKESFDIYLIVSSILRLQSAGWPEMSPSAITTPASDGDTEKVNLVRIAHVYYTHAKFEREHQFLTDFGFTEVSRLNVGKSNETIYYRGYGTEPFLYCSTKGQEDAFGGAAFVVESRKDLELATRIIPTASEIWEMKNAPGGGECVTVKDPVDGFMLHLVYGQAQRDMEEYHEQKEFNFVGAFSAITIQESVTDDGPFLQPTEKRRSANKFQRMKKGRHPQTRPKDSPHVTKTPRRSSSGPQTRPFRFGRH